MSEPVVIPIGTIFTITTGEYSDYSVRGVFKALKEIDYKACTEAYLEQHPAQREDYSFKEHSFITWAYQQGYMDLIDSMEWHLSDCSSIHESYLADDKAWPSRAELTKA